MKYYTILLCLLALSQFTLTQAASFLERIKSNAQSILSFEFLNNLFNNSHHQNGDDDTVCYHIHEGHFWPQSDEWPYEPIMFHGFNSNWTVTKRIMIKNDSANYILPSSNPKAKMCENSWNKLFGTTRCGKFNTVHQDSDRFVWRRAQSCLIYNGSEINVKPDCPDINKIEIAAYTYDNGTEPYKHIGTLLKEFNTMVEVEKWYNYTLAIENN